MNWEAVGAVGEIVGAAAVVVTLVYLAGQVRQATRATQAASFQAASALEQEFLLAVGQDPATSRTWAAYMCGFLGREFVDFMARLAPGGESASSVSGQGHPTRVCCRSERPHRTLARASG